MRATINNPIASDSRNPIELPTRRSDSSPRHYISPPLRFNPFYSPPFHRPTFHFLRSFRLVRWPRTRTKQSFHVSVKRDSRQVAASLGNNFDQPLKERRRKCHAFDRCTHHTTVYTCIVRDDIFTPPPIFRKTGNRNRWQRRPFPTRGNSIKLFQKEEK